MAFLSGSFGSTSGYPEFLQTVADVLPLTYLIRLVEDAYVSGESLAHDPTAVAMVVAWGLAGVAVAVRRFGWQPRER
jgi:ABC-2 type transport system permease protein